MPLNINYKKITSNNKSINLMLFVDEKFNIGHLKKYVSLNEFSYISDLLKTSDLKKKFIVFEINSKKKNFINID